MGAAPLSMGIGAPELLIMAVVLVPILGIGAIVAIVFAVYRRQVRNALTQDIKITPVGEGQWTGCTAAGPFVVTDVVTDDRGHSYEIETNFIRRTIDGQRERGDMVRLHYVAPAMAVVRRTVVELAERHLAGLPQSGKTPAEMDRETESRF